MNIEEKILDMFRELNQKLNELDKKLDRLGVEQGNYVEKERCSLVEKQVYEEIGKMKIEIEDLKGKIRTIYVSAVMFISVAGLFWYLFKLVGKI